MRDDFKMIYYQRIRAKENIVGGVRGKLDGTMEVSDKC